MEDIITKRKLKNGLTMIVLPRKTDSIVIEVTAKVGSMNEIPENLGISHFIEHMLFEGTKKRKNAAIIANAIERLGGDINAATSNDRTLYYIKVLKNHFEIALDVMSDIIINPILGNKEIEKERKVILDEINMVNDNPRFYQWVMFYSTLFKESPARNPVYGSKETVKSFSRQHIIDYYMKHYVANNMIMTVIGDVNPGSVIRKISSAFSSMKHGQLHNAIECNEPAQRMEIKTEKRHINQSYFVLGYKTVPRNHRHSYVLDVIKAVLGRGQSGKIFEEVRIKKGLAYDVGVYNDPSINYGVFAVYCNTNRKNIEKVKSIILKEFSKLKRISDKDLSEAKTFIEGSHALDMEDNIKKASDLADWEQLGNVNEEKSYIKRIKSVTKKEIRDVVERYLTKDYVMTVIEQNLG